MGPANFCARTLVPEEHSQWCLHFCGVREIQGRKKEYLLSCLKSCIKPTLAKDCYALMLALVLSHSHISACVFLAWSTQTLLMSCTLNTVWKLWHSCWVWIRSSVGALLRVCSEFVMVMWDHLLFAVLTCHTDWVSEQPCSSCPSCSLRNITCFDFLHSIVAFKAVLILQCCFFFFFFFSQNVYF